MHTKAKGWSDMKKFQVVELNFKTELYRITWHIISVYISALTVKTQQQKSA